jgi:preprotein translocase subunit YajC
MMLVMFGIFYFILIRPQVRKQKEHQALLQKLGKGDEVITRGGVIGKITGISDDGVLVLELRRRSEPRPARVHEGKRTAGPKALPARCRVAAVDVAGLSQIDSIGEVSMDLSPAEDDRTTASSSCACSCLGTEAHLPSWPFERKINLGLDLKGGFASPSIDLNTAIVDRVRDRA